MPRSEFEHLIRAAGAIADDDQIVVIGSQSVLGHSRDFGLPAAVQEADRSSQADAAARPQPSASRTLRR